MSQRTEKRTTVIPPCVVDKELVQQIGVIVNKVIEGGPCTYSIESSKVDIESGSWEHFIKSDWPDTIDELSIKGRRGTTRFEKETFKIRISFNTFFDSTINVSGPDATWVEGVSNQLYQVFLKKRYFYWYIHDYSIVKLIISTILYASFSYTINWLINEKISPLFNILPYNYLPVLLTVGLFFVPTGVSGFLFWLFPRYEYGDQFPQRNLRKAIWALVTSSGIISWLLQQFL